MRKRPKPIPAPAPGQDGPLPTIPRRRDDAVPLDSLIPHPDNDNQGDLDAIEESLLSKGQYKSIVVQESTRYILAGNHTWAAMQRLGAATISADFVDVDDATALEILLADNATARHGFSAAEATAKILRKLKAMRPDGGDVLRGTGLAGLSGTEAVLKRLRDAPAFLAQSSTLDAPSPSSSPSGGSPSADGGDGPGPGPERERRELARHPLSIVLSNAEKRRWDAARARLGVRDDKSALLALLAALDAPSPPSPSVEAASAEAGAPRRAGTKGKRQTAEQAEA